MTEKGGDNGMRKAQGAPVTERGTATPHSETSQNEDVRQYWDQEACGTYESVVGTLPELSREWFALIEQHRYAMEPFIQTFAQFPAHRGKTMLEVGVGAGTDHLQWARAGAVCHGVDLTQRAIDTTQAHLALHGLSSNLQRIDAETLPFPNEFFDVVYSWGVISPLGRSRTDHLRNQAGAQAERHIHRDVICQAFPRAVQALDQTCLADGTALEIMDGVGC